MAAAAGVALWAWRGKQIDEHPLCRRCGYDLTGLDLTRPSESGRICSECGTQLASPRNIRIGHRQRRRVLFTLATLFLFVLIGAGISGAVVAVSQTRHYDGLPSWVLGWVVTEAPNGSNQQTRAIAVLGRRAGGSDVRSSLSGMVDRILARQRRANAPGGAAAGIWSPAWANLLLQLQQYDQISPEQWERYLRQIPVWAMTLRRTATPAEPFYIRHDLLAPTAPTAPPWPAQCRIRYIVTYNHEDGRLFRRWPLLGEPAQGAPKSAQTYLSPGVKPHTASEFLPQELLRQLPPGEVRLRARLTAWVNIGAWPSVKTERELPLTFTVDPSRTTALDAVTDEQSLAAFTRALGPPGIFVTPLGEPTRVLVRIPMAAPQPHAALFTLRLVDAGEELGRANVVAKPGDRILTAEFRRGTGALWRNGTESNDAPIPPFLDIELTPDHTLGIEDLDCKSYYAAPVQLKWVPVRSWRGGR